MLLLSACRVSHNNTLDISLELQDELEREYIRYLNTSWCGDVPFGLEDVEIVEIDAHTDRHVRGWINIYDPSGREYEFFSKKIEDHHGAVSSTFIQKCLAISPLHSSLSHHRWHSN